MRRCALFVSLAVLLSGAAVAQNKIHSGHLNERVIAVVPMVGAGTFDDPKRPLHAPKDTSPDGIIEFSYELSDDGNYALVEFAARDRKALLPILNDSRLAGKVFEKGKARKDDIEREFTKVKRDFDLGKFGGGR